MLKIAFKHFTLAGLIFISLALPTTTKAVNSPILTSPGDNEILGKTPKLTWDFVGECVESGSCFMVEIDNNSDFSSREKSSYTDKNSYSPQGLSNGTWFWRVKAKDKSEKWSEWSNVFKFSISENLPSPSPTPSPSLNPTPTPKPSVKKLDNIFEINTDISEINSDNELEINIKIITDDIGKIFYLKGAFKKEDSNNYFGFTNFDDTWVPNSAKYLNQFKTFPNESGQWDGKLRIKPDSEDAGFTGSGEYILKVGRYSESGSGPTWSNELKIKITEVEKPEEEPDSVYEEISDEATKEANLDEETIESTLKPEPEFKIASVAGVSQILDNTPLEETETVVLEKKQINWPFVFAGIAILIGTGGFLFYKVKTKNESSRGALQE